MKKIILSIIFLISGLTFILGIVTLVKADDTAVNPVFWIKDKKTKCLSVINPEDLDNNYFLLFDYSSKIGEELGKPWVIVEKEKCYTIDKGLKEENYYFGSLYLMKIKDGNEREKFSDYTKFKPSDNVSPEYYKWTHPETGEELPIAKNLIIWPDPYFQIGSNYFDQLHSIRDFMANDFFPTKYDFGIGMTIFYSAYSPETEKLVSKVTKDESFIKIEELYSKLAEGLNNTINSCDNRIRVEHRLSVKDDYVYEKNIVWVLKDNKSFIFDVNQKLDPLVFIDLIGCRKSFSEFINLHKEDFETINRLAEKLLKKYPNATIPIGEGILIGLKKDGEERSNKKELVFLHKRDESRIEGIFAFAASPEKPVDLSTVIIENKVTPLDEPTSEKKKELIVTSKNLLMQFYIYLPIIAVIGIVIFILLRLFRKRQLKNN